MSQADNIMFRTPAGDLVLTDYGVSLIARAGVDAVTMYGSGRGHIFTRAPEVLTGRYTNSFASDM